MFLTLQAGPEWGRLASPGFENHPIKSTFFFAGNWRNGVQFYETNPSSNIHLYTIHPSDSRHLGWSEREAYRRFAVTTMVDAGINVINMSYWGPRGTDNWAHWAPMQTSTYAHDELFTLATEQNILIAPYIESYAATPQSPGFSFMDDFPGSAQNPAPNLITHITDLLDRYLIHPQNTDWPAQWAQVYDQNGEKRYLFSIIHVASNQGGVTDELFSEGFDRVADKVYEDTGIRIGFALDILPLGTNAPGFFKATPQNTGSWLAQQSSVLAVSCFIPEIWTGSSDDTFLAQWKRQFSSDWIDTGIPFIQDISPGYDAHIVFPGSPIYGNTEQWRQSLSQIIEDLDSEGITFNAWNGYTEGFAGVPTLQYGDASSRWLQEEMHTFSPPVQNITLDYSFPQKGWYLISVPGTAEDMRVSTLFAGTGSDHVWTCIDDQYVQHSELRVGYGYWLYVYTPCTCRVTLSPVSGYTRTLSGDSWVQLGSLYETTLLEDMTATPGQSIENRLYQYNPQSQEYEIGKHLEAQTGYWVYALNDCELVVGIPQTTIAQQAVSGISATVSPPFGPPRFTAIPDHQPRRSEYLGSPESLQNYPNPFNPSTWIEYELYHPAFVKVRIYTVDGKQVETLFKGQRQSGTHRLLWDTRSRASAPIPSGVYLIHIQAGRESQTLKTLLLR
jgi:hypothetical protein